MKKYRIKEKDGKFYPQKRLLFFWVGFDGEPYWDYGTSSFLTAEKILFYHDDYFPTYDEANKFLVDYKKSIKTIYHEIVE